MFAMDMHSPPLVSPAWLAAHLSDPSVLVLDIRSAVDGGGRPAFEAGHVPGAVHTDYVQDGWRAVAGPASGLLPAEADLAELFGALGITPDSHVIVVPAGVGPGDFSAAARVYWTLKTAGHRQVSILDGGFAAWRDEGRPVEPGPGGTRRAPAYPVVRDRALHADTSVVEKAVRESSAALVDARSRPYFEGRAQSPAAARPGRLPGAVLVDNAAAYDAAANRLRPRDELERLFAAVPSGPSISYCNTGHQAATDWFVLSEILGRPQAMLYDGSMSDWTQDPSRPVEAG
jgi:thiosulfate/3-mercaptopyruvate sulfurtransferase